MSRDLQKQNAAVAAARLVETGMYVGLGSGSTSMLAVRALGARLQAGEVAFRGVCTSQATLRLAQELGIPCDPLPTNKRPDLYIDGADQVDPHGRMIKGGGGALLREKIIAAASHRHVIIVDEAKPVPVLGVGFPLPVDVNPFGVELTIERIKSVTNATIVQRLAQGESPFLTDDGNFVVDCHFASGMDDPVGLDAALRLIPGVVETGIFIGLCDLLIIGTDTGTDTRTFD